ncbi:MAG: adenylate/guanylate cyclase domain-containing protein [Candidatus Gracilibacteria bacterium]|nr:adenylate/guanylate cyclase domain-containing protein [Candidatus Gracilibacteria bacterium]
MKLPSFLHNKIFSAVLISLLITALSAILIFTGIFHSWHLKIADTLYTRNEPSKEIIIIGIDDKSTQANNPGLGRFGLWSRENYVELLKILTPENPKVITFDILFNTKSKGMSFNQLNNLQREIANEPSFENKLKIYQEYTKNYASLKSHPVDNEFAEELKKHSNIILLGIITDSTNTIISPLSKFLENNTMGIVSDFTDQDGLMRRVNPSFIHPQTKKQYDDLAVATIKKYLEQPATEHAIATDKNPESNIQNFPLENGKLLVNFFGDPFSFKEISFVDVLNKNFDTGTFTNKIVLVGVTTLKEGQDRVLTPRSNAIPMTGIEFRANEMQTILEGKFLQNQKTASLILMIFVIGFGLAILFIYTGIMVSFIGLLIGLGGYYFSAHLAYKSGLILNMVYPFIAILMAYIFAWIYRYFIADKKKREITSAFSHYVSEDLVEQISKNPDAVKLGGEKKVITVFFTDLKDSTALSEKTEITSWISQLNEYFTVMEKVIKHFGGTIDKYEGDAIMGFWNAPIADPDHILKGYMAAIEMKKYLKILNVKWAKDGRPTLQMRIGINTGEAIVGNMGSTGRFDYTAMGDTVNVASRLESCASKVYGGIVAVLGFEKFGNAEELKKKIVLREIDTVILPGKKDPMTIWEAVCGKQELTTEIQNNLQNYEKGLSAYRSKDFTSAENYFTACANDPVAEVMLARVKDLAGGKPIKDLSENMIFRIGNK